MQTEFHFGCVSLLCALFINAIKCNESIDADAICMESMCFLFPNIQYPYMSLFTSWLCQSNIIPWKKSEWVRFYFKTCYKFVSHQLEHSVDRLAFKQAIYWTPAGKKPTSYKNLVNWLAVSTHRLLIWHLFVLKFHILPQNVCHLFPAHVIR